jgi:enoyl-[acyl-carrier-protein] reductase (NADH)
MRFEMLLENTNALVYGAGGKIGAAVARAFAREGANAFLAGRTLTTLEAVAAEISIAGGTAETAEVDALDEQAVEEHASSVAGRAGSIDVSFNAISLGDVQGTPLLEMPLEDSSRPIMVGTTTHLLTARAAARHMLERGSAVILPGPDEPLGFEQHVKPLFRERDRQSMRFAFDLWSHDDVGEHAEAILDRLRAGTMPCDGAWPDERVEMFERWMESGKPA